jgi:hypothetical protein
MGRVKFRLNCQGFLDGLLVKIHQDGMQVGESSRTKAPIAFSPN